MFDLVSRKKMLKELEDMKFKSFEHFDNPQHPDYPLYKDRIEEKWHDKGYNNAIEHIQNMLSKPL